PHLPTHFPYTTLFRSAGVKPGPEGRWTARCPAHDDQHASLSVSRGDDDRALVHCHAGCTTQSICKALRLTVRDLFQKQTRRIVRSEEHTSELQSRSDL